MMERVIITGPTGAIGMALIKELTASGTEVVAVCHKGSPRIKNIPRSDHVQVVECDLSEIGSLPEQLDKEKGYGCFIHLAWAGAAGDARNDIGLQMDNIRYTLDAVEVAARLGCRRFIGAGSQAEYGRTNEILKPNTPTFPENGYGMAKLCAGQMSRLRCEQLGIEHIWTRILSVYGPYDSENTLISALVRTLKKGGHFACTGAEQIWDYIYSDDAAKAFVALMDNGIPGKTYMIASGESHPLKYYIDIVKDQINPDAVIGYGEVPYGEKQVMNLRADISGLTDDTGFRIKTDFAAGIDSIR